MSRKYGWRERARGTKPQRSYRKQHKQSLHFRNIAPKQTRSKGRRQLQIPWSNRLWAGTPLMGAIGGFAAVVSERLQTQFYWESGHQLQHIIWGNQLHTNENGTWTTMAATTPSHSLEQFFGTHNELSQRRGHQNVMQMEDRSNQESLTKTVVQEGIYRDGDRVVADIMTYGNGIRPIDENIVNGVDDIFIVSHNNGWIFPNNIGPTDSPTFNIGDRITVTRAFPRYNHTPGQLIWTSSSSSIGSHYADAMMHSVEFSTYHKYRSVWNQVKDWVSDDGKRTGEDYYDQITGHPGFCDVMFRACGGLPSYIFGTERYNQNTWSECRDKPSIDFAQYKAFLFQYEWHHKSGKWALRVQHKTDRDGPCGTCRTLMERVPVVVEGILL